MLLHELLDSDLLRRAGTRVVAGTDHLDREVRWVHSGEIADIAHYLSGGEVLLTAATGLAASERDRRRYIRELADVNVAAVIVELGRTFDRIPPEMVDEAQARGLVLVELEREVPFVGVTQAVATSIVNQQHQVLTRATEIGDAVGQLILDGASLPAMMELLAERLRNPVVLEDGSRHAVAFGRSSGPIAPLLGAWQAHSRQGHHLERSVSVQRAASDPPCAWSVIALRGEIWGRLHVLEVDTPLDPVAELALGRAAASIALHLAAERGEYLNETAEHSLVSELARGASFGREEFMGRAAGLGVNFDGELIVLVIGRVDGTAAKSEHEALTSDEVQMVREALRQARWSSLLGSLDGRVVAVAAADPPGGVTQRLPTLLDALAKSSGRFSVGVSRPTRSSQLSRAFTEAQTAQILGPATDQEQIHYYDDLVLHRLLVPLLQGPELANFVESELGELIAYDEQHRTNLLHTLDTYLQHNGSKASAAQALHLQRRSVYYRLERIERLLGRSIESPVQRVRLYVALRARELLSAQRLGRSSWADKRPPRPPPSRPRRLSP